MQHVGVLWAVAVLALVAFFVGARGRAIDADAHERYASDLARLQTLDHRLNEGLLNARTGRLRSYDPLVYAMTELRETHARLARAPAFLPADRIAELEQNVARSAERLHIEADLLEDFKRDNAVLLNSLRFLPIATDDLRAHVSDPAVLARAEELVRRVLVVSVWRDEDAPSAAEIRGGLAAIEGLPEEQSEILAAHMTQVVERRRAVETALSALLAEQSERARLGLEQDYRVAYALADRRSSRDATILFALAIASVVLGALFIILRMRRAAHALQQTSAQLASAVDMKNRFVSMTSHEFRTPLSVILSSTELLEAYSDRWKPEKKKEHFDRIRGSIASMTQLIDGILLIGRGDAGVLDWKPARTDVDRLCREVVAAVKAKHGGGRTIDYQPPDVARVIADERLLRHVLDNLLSNAIKYSPEGGKVGLVVRCDGRELVMRISDEGIGIPEADRARLFESFRRGANVGAIPGTGLGLAVVRRAVELHRGTITVESAVGAGSTFEVRIPVTEEASEGEAKS